MIEPCLDCGRKEGKTLAVHHAPAPKSELPGRGDGRPFILGGSMSKGIVLRTDNIKEQGLFVIIPTAVFSADDWCRSNCWVVSFMWMIFSFSVSVPFKAEAI
jgi:hypothetical protein